MRLNLNVKEWLAIYGLLERQSHSQDKQLLEVYNRMKSTLTSVLNSTERSQFETWLTQTAQKIEAIKTEESKSSSKILTDDDDESVSEYPRSSKVSRRRGNKK